MRLAYFQQTVPPGHPEYVMSQSSLKAFAACPWAWINGKEVERSENIVWGSLVDCLLLEPHTLGESFVVRPAFYPSPTKSDPAAKKPWNLRSNWCKKWLDENKKGRDLIDTKTFKEATVAVETAKADAVTAASLEVSRKQLECRWEYKDPFTSVTVPLKCMIDLAPDGYPYLADFKTTQNADREGFRGKARAFRYDIQASFYLWGYRECYEDSRAIFAFFVQESSRPYAMSHWFIQGKQLEYGEYGWVSKWRNYEGWRSMLQRYCKCLDSGTWPSYTNDLTELEIFSE